MGNETRSGAPQITAYADKVVARTGLLRNVYLVDLAGGALDLPSFRRSQSQFYYAVRYFPRPMAALLSRLPDPSDRLDILHNLVEEHGDFRRERFHANTFATFLKSIEADVPNPEGPDLSPAVHAFNSVLMCACANEPVEVGLGCLGVIEYAFAGISAQIGRAVVDRGWVRSEELVHYALHAELDVRHAQEFFAVIEPGWEDARRRLLICQGLELGAYAFNRLYCDMRAI